MAKNRRLGYVIASAALIAGMCAPSFASEKYYFRLRPSIQILNQESFSVRIEGDRAGVVGSRFAAKAEASAPRESLRFSVSSGGLPPGVTLNSLTGDISGNPTAKGNYSAVVTAKDAFSTASAPLSAIIYDEMSVESTVSAYATVGKPYSASFKGVGGDENYRWSVTGTLPSGLSLGSVSSPTAILSGTPTAAGTWSNLRVNLADGAGHNSSSSAFSITVADPLTLDGAPSSVATVGFSYAATFTSSGGHAPLAWTMSGTLPAGLSFANGTISGTPTAAVVASGLVVRVTDVAGNVKASNPFSIAVSQPLSLAATPSEFATVGTGYSASFTATGGDGNYSWDVVGGSLPQGLTLANGNISGTPTVAETRSNIVVRVTDGNGRTAQSNPFSIVVSNVLTASASAPAPGTVGVYQSAAIASASGGNGSYTWSVASGSLPNGLSISGGSIVGTPTAAGTWSVVLRATD